MKKLILVMMVLGLALPTFASIRINPNDDVTIRNTTNYDEVSPFGLFVKNSTDVSYLEFTLGNDTATEAKLVVHNDDAGVTALWDIAIKAAEYSFDETTLNAYNTGAAWAQIGTIEDVMGIAFYEVDLTSWYNANLGKTMSLFLTRNVQPSGSGPIFEDREGTKTGDAVTYGPRLEVTVVPEPATLALLGLGALVLRRKR